MALAACGSSTSGTAGTSAGGSTGSGGTTPGSGGASGGAGGTGGAADNTCTAEITDASGSNVGVAHFEVDTAGGFLLPQGSGTTKSGMTAFGVSALQSTAAGANTLRINVIGAMPSAGATYATTADLGVGVDSTPSYLGFGVPNGSQGADWVADAGTVVTVTKVGPGPLPSYNIITFSFSGAHMTPVTMGGDQATGTFTMTGTCTAAIQFK